MIGTLTLLVITGSCVLFNTIHKMTASTNPKSLNQAKEISISIAGSSGTPADGYVVSKVDYSPKLLTISGSKNALANISTVSIPSRELDITGASSNKTFEIAIEQYLPEASMSMQGQSVRIHTLALYLLIETDLHQSESFPSGAVLTRLLQKLYDCDAEYNCDAEYFSDEYAGNIRSFITDSN